MALLFYGGHAAGGAVAHAYSDAESIESMAQQTSLDASGAAKMTWLMHAGSDAKAPAPAVLLCSLSRLD
jgi:hypothetical protein